MNRNRLRTLLAAIVCAVAAIQHWQQLRLELLSPGEDDSESDDDAPKPKRRRRSRPRSDYSNSGWAVMLRQTALLSDPNTTEGAYFRRRFRVPYPFFLALVREVKAGRWEGFTTTERDIGGRPCIPVELKVLAVLYILGRGNYFDDITQMSCISEPTVQRVFHAFTARFSRELFSTWVKLPTGADLKKVMDDYDDVGFTGAVGSTDVTHVHWQLAPFSKRRSYTGKEGFPTLAYECTVDHSGRLLACTRGFPGAQNDKTIVRFDGFVRELKVGMYKDIEYTLTDAAGQPYKVKGLYTIVDGGYHFWRVLQCAPRAPITEDEQRFRNWQESVRKDVECFFGILKGRFRILKMALLYGTKEKIDNIFYTCCILHNMLHSFDGIALLETGINWGGVEGNIDSWLSTDQPIALPNTDAPASTIEVESGFHQLQKQLTAHFIYRMRNGLITWKKS